MRNTALVMGAIAASLVGVGGGVVAAKSKAPAKKAPAKVKGNVKAGEKLFHKRFPKECQGCHKFGKVGSTALGPDLTHVGKKMSAAKIKIALKNPKALNPKTIMPPMKGSDKDLTDIAAFLATQK